MKIDVQVREFNNGNTKGFADVVIDERLVVKGFAIVEGKNGLFVSMPSHKGKDGKFYDNVYFKTKEDREKFNDLVIKSFNDLVGTKSNM